MLIYLYPLHPKLMFQFDKPSLKVEYSLKWSCNERVTRAEDILEYQIILWKYFHHYSPFSKSLLQRYNDPVNNVSTRIPSWFFWCYSPGRDDRLAGCWRSSEHCLLGPRSPGDGQVTSPSAHAAPGHSRDKSTGVPRCRLHGDEATGWPRLRLTPLWSVTKRLRGDFPT